MVTTFVDSNSEADTDAFAARVAAALRPGTTIALEGPMGAGKTRFVRGLVKAMGGDVRRVSSPTFVLLNVYSTPSLTLYHLDAYRIGGEEDFEGIGFEELLEQGGVTLVEWASRVEQLLPPATVRLSIEVLGEEARRFYLTGIEI